MLSGQESFHPELTEFIFHLLIQDNPSEFQIFNEQTLKEKFSSNSLDSIQYLEYKNLVISEKFGILINKLFDLLAQEGHEDHKGLNWANVLKMVSMIISQRQDFHQKFYSEFL